MAYTMEQANALLANIHTEAELRNLVSQLDISTSGNVTVLYSGMVGSVHSSAIVQGMIDGGENIRVINNTEAAKFLDWESNEAFGDALGRVFGTNPGEPGSTASQFLQGSLDPSGNRIPNGAWDDVSGRFVASATGDIRTITPFADTSRIFSQTEVLAALNNTSISSIDGVPRETLLGLYNDTLSRNGSTAALEDVTRAVSSSSWNNIIGLEVAASADGTITAVGSNRFFEGTTISGTQLPDGTANRAWVGSFMNDMTDPQWNNLNQGEQALIRASSLATALDSAAPVLNKAGVLGTVIGLSIVAKDAQAAIAVGDHAGAAMLLAEWAAETTGGFAAGLVAAESAAAFFSPLLAAGPAGIAAYTILVGGSGIVGSIYGEKLTSDVLDYISGRTTNLTSNATTIYVYGGSSTNSDRLVLSGYAEDINDVLETETPTSYEWHDLNSGAEYKLDKTTGDSEWRFTDESGQKWVVTTSSDSVIYRKIDSNDQLSDGFAYLIKEGEVSNWGIDANGSLTGRQEMDAANGTVGVIKSATQGPNTVESSLYSLNTGTLIGETTSLPGDNLYNLPTPDPLSSFINLIRTDLSLEEQALLNATEIGALTGTQGLSDSWGGVNLLEFSGGILGDYWNSTHDTDFTGDYYDYFDNPVDYSLTGAGNYASLGFMPAFPLAGNSGSFLSTGYTARGFDSYTSFLPTSWQFDAIAWNNINTAPLSTTPSLFDALGGNNLITSVNDGFGNISYEWRIAGSGDSSTVFYYGSGSYGDNIFLPLALDLDGDGVELVSKEDSRAYYDVKGDGFRHNVGWIGADDAFLAIDKNSDGKIELADELSFALWTPDPSDTDLQALINPAIK